MRTKTVEKWVWILIYAGLIAVALGLAVRDTADGLTAWLVALGVVAVVTGAVLIWVRSRMTGQRTQPSTGHDEPSADP